MSSAGVLSGTSFGTFNNIFTVTASGPNGTVSKVFSLVIAPSAIAVLSISNATITDGVTGPTKNPLFTAEVAAVRKVRRVRQVTSGRITRVHRRGLRIGARAGRLLPARPRYAARRLHVHGQGDRCQQRGGDQDVHVERVAPGLSEHSAAYSRDIDARLNRTARCSRSVAAARIRTDQHGDDADGAAPNPTTGVVNGRRATRTITTPIRVDTNGNTFTSNFNFNIAGQPRRC
jgi:hypothetical protein